MAQDSPLRITSNTLTKGLAKYNKKLGLEKPGGADFNAKQKVGLQGLNWMVNGSSHSSRVPPIQKGILRGSGTVFVGDVQVGDMKSSYPAGTPASSHSDKPDVITWGFNTSYAAKLHETKWIPGGKIPSKQAKANPNILGDVGNKYVELHLKADKKSLLKLYAKFVKKGTGA